MKYTFGIVALVILLLLFAAVRLSALYIGPWWTTGGVFAVVFAVCWWVIHTAQFDDEGDDD